ncbi:MAG: hypothetical protein EPN53_10425 [Acidobacteria bacterium]|nr:MAG: hypothetical protein EPN53_10425 [Acidobacteriota bacterium]
MSSSDPGRRQAPGVPSYLEVTVAQNAVPPCPHCGQPLARFSLPDEGGWDGTFQLACFNDDCPYFVRGWAWIEEHYGVRSSYRYRLDPASGQASPIPVWSRNALRDRILEDDVLAGPSGEDVIPGDAPGQGGEGI